MPHIWHIGHTKKQTIEQHSTALCFAKKSGSSYIFIVFFCKITKKLILLETICTSEIIMQIISLTMKWDYGMSLVWLIMTKRKAKEAVWDCSTYRCMWWGWDQGCSQDYTGICSCQRCSDTFRSDTRHVSGIHRHLSEQNTKRNAILQ